MINKDTQLCMSLSGRPGNTGTYFHNYLYQKLNLNFIYKAFSTTDIEHAIKGVRALGVRGCAVSMPFKEACMPFIDEIDASAQAIKSVNTIINTDGFLKAYNTDYIAIKTLIISHKLDPAAHVIILGSGGMAKAVACAFKDSGFDHVTICACNQQTGQYLATLYGYQYSQSLDGLGADILVNVTPIGMQSGAQEFDLAFPKAMIDKASTAFDVVAMPAETPFIEYAKAQGKHIICGSEVMTLQAVEQFVLYTGIRPSDELIAEAAAFARS